MTICHCQSSNLRDDGRRAWLNKDDNYQSQESRAAATANCFFTTSAHATSGRGFLHLRKCLKCTLHTEVLPNGETTYTLESSVSSLTIQNTTNSTRSSNTTGEKKRTSGEHPLFEVGSPCSPETWPCIFRHLPQDH